MEKEKLSITLI